MRYTKEHVQAVLQQHGSVRAAADALHMSPHGIYWYMKKYGLTARNHHWTTQEDNYIRFHAYHKSHKSIAKHLGVSLSVLKARYNYLGLRMYNCVSYSTQQFARDCGMATHNLSHLWRERMMPHKRINTRIVLDYLDVMQWLEDGNILRLDPSTMSEQFKEIYEQARKNYICTDELRSIAAWRADQLVDVPTAVCRIDTGWVYKRSDIFAYLALHYFLLYARASSAFAEEIKAYTLAHYVTSAQLHAYHERLVQDLWRERERNDFPKPLRTRPNVFERAAVLAWLRERRHIPRWHALYQHLMRYV